VLFVLLAGYAIGLVVMTGCALLSAPRRATQPVTTSPTGPSAADVRTHDLARDLAAALAAADAADAARDAHEMVTWSLDGLGAWLAQNDDLALEARVWLRTQLGHHGAVNG